MADYLSGTRVCDMVMKGGVTSGVLYPPAIDEIAQRFWLCGIGGTSAGAIAAGLTAAAEYRRRNDDPANDREAGYRLLNEIPDEVGGAGQVLSLFRPDETTEPLFKLFLRIQEAGSAGFFGKASLVREILGKVVFGDDLAALPPNHMGLCTGMANGQRRDGHGLPPLTEWLSRKIDRIAGVESPLTFGDLWTARLPPPLAKAGIELKNSIQLQLISTCLTFGRPYALPFLDNRFAFCPKQFRLFFPEYVVDAMEKAGKEILDERNARLAAEGKKDTLPLPDGLLPFPQRERMPVIVAVRMSLSFPVLFSAVPLYFPNFHRGEQPTPWERVCFADGGITSNLPVHFFDSPLPRWPTLAINLQYAKHPNEFGRRKVGPCGVHLPASNAGGTLDLFNDFLELIRQNGRPPLSPLKKLGGLIGAVFRSAQTWSDNSFLSLPGYRDRVVEIWLNPDEGGMNLNMPPETIRKLIRKGRSAGKDLVSRFADAPPTDAMSWNGHRWTRARSALAALEDYIAALQRSVDHPMPGEPTIHDLMAGVTVPPSYEFKKCGPLSAADRLDKARQALDELVAHARLSQASHLCDETSQDGDAFCTGPRPRLSLQARASMVPEV